MKRVTQLLLNRYDIKSGPAEKLLGMNITDNSRFFYCSQPRMVDKLLVRFNMELCKSVATPMDNNISYNIVDDQLHEDVRGYREAIRRLLWMANMTRPDISYAVSIAARHRE